MSLSDLKSKRILIYGFAREGQSTLAYLRKHFGDVPITIADEKPLNDLDPAYQKTLVADKNVKLMLGLSDLDALIGHFDILFKAPGIPNKRLPIGLRRIVTNQTQLFLENCRGQVFGVTGTKGKSTTASILYEVLKSAGKKTVLLGNIGKPPLDFLDENNSPETIFVFEMSSHQLSNVKISPHIAILLNFFPEHLDYYESIDDYAAAKENITKFQTEKDYLVYNRDDKVVSQIAQKSQAKKVAFDRDDLHEVREVGEVRVIGEMNQMNILAVVKVAQILKIDKSVVSRTVQKFQPLEHRLELVGTFKGITFYNDSLATIPEATIAALNSFGDRVETLFIGGFDRGVDYKMLAKRILDSKIRHLILFPTTGEKVWDLIKKGRGSEGSGGLEGYEVDQMKDAVEIAYKKTSPGKIALLSPAATSFNLFKDYRDRGNQFKDWVVRLGKK